MTNINCQIKICEHNLSGMCSQKDIDICDCGDGLMCNKYEEIKDYKYSQFEVIKLDVNDFNYLIIAKSYRGITPFLEDAFKYIEDEYGVNKSINLIFDNLLHNGFNSDRYFTTRYNGDIATTMKSFKHTGVNKRSYIANKSKDYFMDNQELLENGILVSTQVKLYKKGLI